MLGIRHKKREPISVPFFIVGYRQILVSIEQHHQEFPC